MKILDCTLRDGGYYTNWDFSNELVDCYLDSFNNLPVDYLEIGYRNLNLEGYHGKFYYCPVPILEKINNSSNKKLVIILDEKNIDLKYLPELLLPIQGLINMIRIAVHPKNISRALPFTEKVKTLGFETCFNLMYMSNWKHFPGLFKELKHLEGIVDYLYMVDSFGGVYPKDVKEVISEVRKFTNIKLGFHGHNNLELGLINSLVAIDHGVEIIDATITGMGRGAGNLKMELFLTVLHEKGTLGDLDYNSLSRVVTQFDTLGEEYNWGTSLPYMVSGANSFPQKEVMEWVSKRYYSYNSIIRALNNRVAKVSDNIKLPKFLSKKNINEILIVGGGDSIKKHQYGINEFISSKPNLVIIHASSKNVPYFKHHKNHQVHCISGNEGHRLESIYAEISHENREAVLPPFPRSMGTYIPNALFNVAHELEKISFTSKFKDSVTAIVLELTLGYNPKNIFVVGYDGYQSNVSRQELELFNENEYLFSQFHSHNKVRLEAILPTSYSNLNQTSLYKLI